MAVFELFAKSPFRPMQEHMKVVRGCVEQLEPLFEALCTGRPDQVRSCYERIDELEGQADRLKNDLRAHLPKRLFLPVDRRDLLEILDLQDTIADVCQDIAELLTQRPFEVPEAMKPGVRSLAAGVERTCGKASEVIDRLDELVEIGFRGREAERVEVLIDELGRLEGETDRVESELNRTLFGLEDELSAVSVMFWYQLLRWTGNVADAAEKVGNRVRLLIAR